ncbi:hypothetical protein SNEBB_002680 [Seison nebaliae]|nr:hypothetical protein SNEBB_002680 [Seison nebaliae]
MNDLSTHLEICDYGKVLPILIQLTTKELYDVLIEILPVEQILRHLPYTVQILEIFYTKLFIPPCFDKMSDQIDHLENDELMMSNYLINIQALKDYLKPSRIVDYVLRYLASNAYVLVAVAHRYHLYYHYKYLDKQYCRSTSKKLKINIDLFYQKQIDELSSTKYLEKFKELSSIEEKFIFENLSSFSTIFTIISLIDPTCISECLSIHNLIRIICHQFYQLQQLSHEQNKELDRKKDEEKSKYYEQLRAAISLNRKKAPRKNSFHLRLRSNSRKALSDNDRRMSLYHSNEQFSFVQESSRLNEIEQMQCNDELNYNLFLIPSLKNSREVLSKLLKNLRSSIQSEKQLCNEIQSQLDFCKVINNLSIFDKEKGYTKNNELKSMREIIKDYHSIRDQKTQQKDVSTKLNCSDDSKNIGNEKFNFNEMQIRFYFQKSLSEFMKKTEISYWKRRENFEVYLNFFQFQLTNDESCIKIFNFINRSDDESDEKLILYDYLNNINEIYRQKSYEKKGDYSIVSILPFNINQSIQSRRRRTINSQINIEENVQEDNLFMDLLLPTEKNDEFSKTNLNLLSIFRCYQLALQFIIDLIIPLEGYQIDEENEQRNEQELLQYNLSSVLPDNYLLDEVRSVARELKRHRKKTQRNFFSNADELITKSGS